jgi:hypothetical protein
MAPAVNGVDGLKKTYESLQTFALRPSGDLFLPVENTELNDFVVAGSRLQIDENE